MSFAGFDTGVYPGDAQMEAGKAALPYLFCGYYLKSPCHPGASWMGKRPTLIAQGWNCLIIYVGQQTAGASPCPRNTLTTAQAIIDGNDAVQKAGDEAFPQGSYIYLDVEAVDPTNPNLPALQNYVQAWVGQVLGSHSYRPAVYCHRKNAVVMQQVVAAAGGGPDVRFWVVGSGNVPFSLATEPSDSGVAFATAWQNPVSTTIKFGAVAVNIDEDVASFADPSAPALQDT
jgi:Domain of unknown function (DUF1906)